VLAGCQPRAARSSPQNHVSRSVRGGTRTVKPRSRTKTPGKKPLSQRMHGGRRLLAVAAVAAIVAGAFLATTVPAHRAAKPDTVSAHGLAGSVPTRATARSDASDGTIALDSVYTFVLFNLNSFLCLGISGGDDDAPAVQWTCEEVPNQEWHYGSEYGNSGYYQLINGDGECLGVAGSSKSQGARVVGWTCNGHLDQYWQGVGISDGTVFYNYNSGLVLGVAGNSKAVGAAVVQWPFQGDIETALNQFWEVEGIS